MGRLENYGSLGDITIFHSERSKLQIYFYSEVLVIGIYLHSLDIILISLFACGNTGMLHRYKGEH